VVTKIGEMLPFLKRTMINFVVKYVKKMVPAFSLEFTYFTNALEIGAMEEHKPFKSQMNDTAVL
jgi:long-chain acyl-CoA synthetase